MKSGTGSWRDIHSTVTGSDGRVTINSVLGNQVQFRAISEGSWERLASTSSEVEVKVDPILTLRAPSITYIGKVETFTATLTPATESKSIALERFDSKKGAFVEVARAKVDLSGVATFALALKHSNFPAFSSFRARLIVKDQSPAATGASNPLVSPTLWMTTLKP